MGAPSNGIAPDWSQTFLQKRHQLPLRMLYPAHLVKPSPPETPGQYLSASANVGAPIFFN